MLELILPDDVSVADCRDDPPDAALLVQEEALVEGVVPARRAEVTVVRHLARRALAGIGVGPVPLLRGASNVPVWPAGVVGSMTHCTGYRAAAVASAERFRAIGIDAEPSASISAGALRIVASAREKTWVSARRATDPSVAWDRLLFSAKEAFYKVWSPLTGTGLGFRDIEISPSVPGRLSIVAVRPDVRETARRTECRWLARDGLLVVSAWIRADGPVSSSTRSD